MKDNTLSPTPFEIASIPVLGGGVLGICGLPGRFNALQEDLDALSKWAPDLIVSMTESHEMETAKDGNLSKVFDDRNLEWTHLPIVDFGIPDATIDTRWTILSRRIHDILDQRGRILLHCKGGRGRSGMVLLRILVDRQEETGEALERLRAARPGAVETDEQFRWATSTQARGLPQT